ncbi:hypothetical protein KOJ33_004843 [Salmonella enterica]|nr:hypothetical protein [Salmonella enterica subsp. enterica serovar Newport]EHP2853267.1 hypothetical protein [Salmonella enterica]EKH2093935.1 hypothetical protein [Salmonella enterica]
MTIITREWLQQTIAEFENTRDDIPFGLDDDDAKILLVLKQAMASLDAEPIVPDDWQLVPKNPTGPMLAAGYQAYMKGQHRGRFYRSYQAMLEAAPKLSEVDHDDDK